MRNKNVPYKNFRKYLALAFTVLFTTFSSFTAYSQEEGKEDAGAADATESTEEASTEGAAAAGDAEAGKELFLTNCATCHDKTLQADMAGPALKGVMDRVPKAPTKREWLGKWIRNSGALIASGDKYAVEVFNKFGKTPMTAFESFTDADIDNILAFIQAGGIKPAATPAGGDGAGAATGGPSQGGGNTMLVMSIVLVALVLIIAVLVLMSTSLNRQLAEKEGLDDESKRIIHDKHNVLTIIKHPAFYGSVIALLLAVGLVTLVQKGLYGIGVQTGYAPSQPIPFSHKKHAGEYKIDCNYCHTGVRKAKHANIPSANICYNCHSKVKADKNEDGTIKNKNIRKIYDALGYNSETQAFDLPVKPIRWVRVHNLPDLAYFNHAQHVAVGGRECQECHGPIEEMEVVRQHSTLTMGWCIDCHRKTTVNLEAGSDTTGYYTKELAIKLLKQKKKSVSKAEWKKIEDFHLGDFESLRDALKVEDIGGTECSKCHY